MKQANRLIHETSPYLLQHAHNPVDWYPWGDEAFQRAKAEDKPVLLSVGYSSCHWCHVMAHESFEDASTAQLMNEQFVNIKVDREERPDVDTIYMRAVVGMTGRGGWPLTVFLTPDGQPFFGGTYFPPESRHGLSAFRQVLLSVYRSYRERKEQITRSAQDIVAHIVTQDLSSTSPDLELSPLILDQAVRTLSQQFDATYGGFGGAPKFPQSMVLEFLLREFHRSGNTLALRIVERSLERIARGGIYDQLGGGFHRYSVDERWLVPHFERMLYDNAQLARVYLHAWQVTGNKFFRTITEEILDYVVREMLDPDAGFYSTQDADSEGEEGKFFVWTPAEIHDVLGDQAEGFMDAYGITPSGNFEGKNILEFVGDMDQRPALAEARRKLFEAREQRVHPNRDEKVLTAWNGLMLAAFAEAARALNRDDYREVAQRNAGFLLRELRQENGRLLRTWRSNPEQGEGAGDAKLNGYLEDHSYLIDGLLQLYQTTFEPRWFVAAQELAETMIAHYQSPEGGFFDTSDDHEALIARPRDLQDNAIPSGNAMAITVLLKLGGFTNDLRYVDIAHQALVQTQPLMAQYPLAFGQWLQALIFALSHPREIAIVGDPEAANTQALLSVVRSGYRPFQVVALGAPDPDPAVPLLRNRGLVDGQAAAYVCRGFACQAPVMEPDGLRAQVESW